MDKVQLFWEGHKNLRNHPDLLTNLVHVKTIRMIAKIFVAFSEKLNFTMGYKQHQNKLQNNFFSLEPVCCKKRQKSPNQETGLGNRGDLKVLNTKDTKLDINKH